ncbi:MAG: GGDEF domain-containing response regulator [bacterium]
MSSVIGNGQRILVVDDEEHIRKIVKFQLEKAGYTVDLAKDGLEALQSIEKSPPDLVLLDLMMPRMDGYEVCRRLKSNYQTSHIPVIMVTAKAELEDKLQGFEGGANDYIAKPFAISELLLRVRNVLQWSQLQRQANPLTGLPGNVAIERELERRLAGSDDFVFMYADLDHFKAFNDYYGYRRGDDAIRLTAEIITKAVKVAGNQSDFVGHIGGDDFVIITTIDRADAIANTIKRTFDKEIVHLFDKEDLDRGYVEVINRKGTIDRFPLLTITIAMVEAGRNKIDHIAKISDIASELKRYGKTLEGSVVVKERRRDGQPATLTQGREG